MGSDVGSAPDTATYQGRGRWRIDRLTNGLGRYAGDWDVLNRQLSGGHPLLDSVFVGNLLAHFGDGSQFICVCHQDDNVVAMCILQRGRLGVWRSFLPPQARVGPTLVTNERFLPSLFAALPGAARAIELLCVDPCCGGKVFGASQRTALSRHAVASSVPLTGTFDAYWARRPENLRRSLGQFATRAIEAVGELALHVLHNPGDVIDGVRRHAELAGPDRQVGGGTSPESQAAQRRFYADLLERHAQLGQSLIYELWAGGRLVASRLVIARGGTVSILSTAVDEERRDWRPGPLQLRRVIEDLYSRCAGMTLEFRTEEAADQLAWAERERTMLRVTGYAGNASFAAAKMLSGLGRLLLRNGRPVEDQAWAQDRVTTVGDPMAMSASERAQLDANEPRQFDLGAQWYDLYCRTVMSSSGGARFITLHRGDFIKAVLPMNLGPALEELGAPVGALANFYTSLYAPGLAADTVPVDLAPLFETVKNGSLRPPSLKFGPMDASSTEFKILRNGLRCAGYSVSDYLAHGNWYLPVQGDWAQYLAQRPGKLRSTIQRMTKRVLSKGGRIEVITDEAALATACAAYERVYARSWKRPEPVRDFMPEFMTWCARRGWLRLGLLWLGDVPTAAQVWVVAHGRAAIFKLAYDDAYAHLAPGTVLSAHLMQRVLDVDGVEEVDFLMGDDQYKRDWMTHRRERRGLVAYDVGTPRGCWLATRAVVSRWVRARRPAGTNAAGKRDWTD